MEHLRVGLLGLNAWIVLLLVPSLHLEETVTSTFEQTAHLGLALCPLLILGLGLRWLRRHVGLAQSTLLALYPVALGLAIALRPALVAREIFDALTITLGALSLTAYFAAAMHACARPRQTKPTTVHVSRSREPVIEPRLRRFVRRALLALTTLFGLGLVALVPIWTGRSERVEDWGEGADDGTVLIIVIATLVATFSLGAIVGPGLRARRRRSPKAKIRRRQFALALGVALVSGIAWLLLDHFDASS